ncbi:MAG: PleD family two-component system response regulator [Acidobacteriota bacterium]
MERRNRKVFPMPRLVLADDNQTVQRIIQASLSAEKIDVSCFSSGSDALEYSLRHEVDVLLASVSLPDMDGYKLCHRLKADSRTAAIPVVLLVGAFQSFDDQRAEEAGCHHHLCKPFVSATLVSIVQARLADEKHKDHSVGHRGPSDTLFGIPPARAEGAILFRLKPEQCRPGLLPFKRELSSSRRPARSPAGRVSERTGSQFLDPKIGQNAVQLFVDKLQERLPRELGRILADINREVVKPSQ